MTEVKRFTLVCELTVSMAKEIFDETVMVNLIVTLSEGHRAKLTPPKYCQSPLCYMSIIHVTPVNIHA